MPRIRSLLALALTLVVFGAPRPSVSATSALNTASAVVYPFAVNGATDKDAGNRLAVLIAQQLAENGVTVKPAPPGSQRKDFLAIARALAVDYYITGYLTPIGAEVSVVEQVVSATSGIVVFSNTAQLLTYGDASGQGQILGVAILRHAGRGHASVEAPRNVPTPEPSATNEANLSGLFKRKKAAAAAPRSTDAAVAATTSPSVRVAAAPVAVAPVAQATARPTTTPPSPATAAPVSVARAIPAPAALAPSAQAHDVALFDLGGAASNAQRSSLARFMMERLGRSGLRVVTAAPGDANLAAHAGELCSQTGSSELVGTSLATRPGDQTYGPSTIATIDVTVVGCDGSNLLATRIERDGTGSRNADRAIERAAADAVVAVTNVRRSP